MDGKVHPQGALHPHIREGEQQGIVVGASGPGWRFQATRVMVSESEAAVSRTPRAGVCGGKVVLLPLTFISRLKAIWVPRPPQMLNRNKHLDMQ